MRTYVITTGIIFALLVVIHVWRVFAERSSLLTEPTYVGITLASATISLWALRLVTRQTTN